MGVGHRATNPIPGGKKQFFLIKSQTSIAGWIFGKRTMQRKKMKVTDFMGTRPVGKTRQRWQEDVMEDPKKLKVKNWKEAAKDRRTWRDLAEKAKTHKGLQCQMMMMMMMMMHQ
jgi:hypothetical protein